MKYPEVWLIVIASVLLVWLVPTKIIQPVAETGGVAFFIAILLDRWRIHNDNKAKKKTP